MATNSLSLSIGCEGASFECECGEGYFAVELEDMTTKFQCEKCKRNYVLRVYNLGWYADVIDDEGDTLAEAEY